MAGKVWVVIGALSAAIAVAAGAVGTHVLKERLELPQSQLDAFDTAVRYQMVHALGLIAIGLLAMRAPTRGLSAAGFALLLGTILFSGGIYAWLLLDLRPLVHVVPFGGLAWIVGWVVLAVSAALGAPPSRA